MEPSLEPDAWRRLIGSWASGVAVLTSRGTGGPRGCTANALTSLSLDPLLLLVCFDLGSNTLQAVRESGRFGVNLLAEGQEAVARHFAVKETELGKFHGVEHELAEGVPVLPGVLGWVACQVERELDGGDHVIVIARPLAGEVDEAASPLVFFRRRYERLSSLPDGAGEVAPAALAAGSTRTRPLTAAPARPR